jgi:pimeloyl-ACP methyl ester carboxylesterase
MPESFAALDSEFAGVAKSAAAAGLGPDAVPRVHRSSVTGPAGEQVSVVVWGSGAPEVVFVHEAGRSARAWDEVALRLGRPSIAIDLPGHGHSDWRRDGRYAPRKLAGAIAEAMRSLAPQARLVVGSGLGGRAALALITTPRPAFLPRLALIDTLPGTAAHGQEAGPGTECFTGRGEAVARLAARHPEWPDAALSREADCELVQDAGGGSWRWRHHLGNLAGAAEPYFDDVTLWEELAGLAKPAFVIHGARSGRLTAADLLDLERRTPRVALITIPGVADVVASEPGRLARQLNRLVSATLDDDGRPSVEPGLGGSAHKRSSHREAQT